MFSPSYVQVVFAGYRIPHPLTPMMVVRIQTTEHSDPPAAMLKAIEQLSKEVDHIKAQLAEAAPRDGVPPLQEQHAGQQGYAGGYDPQYGAAGYGAPPAAAGYGGGYQPAGGGAYGGGY